MKKLVKIAIFYTFRNFTVISNLIITVIAIA